MVLLKSQKRSGTGTRDNKKQITRKASVNKFNRPKRAENTLKMKLKKRIKKALAGFLMEELLEWIGYHHNRPLSSNVPFQIENVPFETVRMEKVIDLTGLNNDYASHLLREQIDHAKKVFAEKVMDNIVVDTRNLINPEYRNVTSVTLSLTVQKKR